MLYQRFGPRVYLALAAVCVLLGVLQAVQIAVEFRPIRLVLLLGMVGCSFGYLRLWRRESAKAK